MTQWENISIIIESAPRIPMPPKHQTQPRGNPVRITPRVHSQVTIAPLREQTPEGHVHTQPLEGHQDQEAFPLAAIATVRPIQVGEPTKAIPTGEPLVPLLAQAIQNLIALISDQTSSLSDRNAQRVKNRGNSIVIQANTTHDLGRIRLGSLPPNIMPSSRPRSPRP